MKDATAELSTTVIAIVAIAAILAVFTVFLLPTLRAQIALTQACSNTPGYVTYADDGTTKTVECEEDDDGDGKWKCTAFNDGKQAGTKTCTR